MLRPAQSGEAEADSSLPEGRSTMAREAATWTCTSSRPNRCRRIYFLDREALRAELERRLVQAVDVVVLRDKPTAFMRQARAEGQRL